MIVIVKPVIGLNQRYLKEVFDKKANTVIKEGEPVKKNKINFKEA